VQRARIRKDDVVCVISGTDKGKTGKVLQVMPTRGRAIVEGIRLLTKAQRKTQDNPQGGFAKKEASLSMSKLLLYCPEDKKGVRIRCVKEGQKQIRKCRRCGHAFDN